MSGRGGETLDPRIAYRILSALSRGGASYIRRLVRECRVGPATLLQYIKVLERRGHVTTEYAPPHRLVRITERGRRLLAALEAVLAELAA